EYHCWLHYDGAWVF
nr:immunoglobulin light chain junction region [Macaca mulatta]MOY07482.1 immunoglobulin light chain junction region [Macaca mulatta]